MTEVEAKKAFDELRAQGETDETILAGLYLMFQNDDLNVEELGALCNVMGYELTDEFKNMSPEDQKTQGVTYDDDKAEGVSEEEVDAAKEVEPKNDNEAKDDEAEKKPEEDQSKAPEGEGKKEEEPAADDKKEEEEDPEKEKNEAMKLFGFNK